MKKFFLLGLALLFLGGASSVKAQDVTVVDDIATYEGSDAYVYSKKDGKTYALNNLGAYELYGVYVKTNTLNIADPSAKPKAIEYIATNDDNKAYINTGYVHKANTRVVADVEITQAEGTADKYRAVFGSRKGGGGGATNGLVYFYHNGASSRGMYKRNVAEYAGADQDPQTESVPINERITIDANGHVLSITKYGESEVFSTIKTPDTEELSVGVNPLFIFDLSTGDGTADGSRARMKLYGFKIYEGETLVRDYEPVVSPEGKGGLRDKESGDVLFAAGTEQFLLSPDAEEKLVPGISVYTGKMVLNTTDNLIYKYNGTDWTDLGARTLDSTIDGDYKNMNNWVTNDDHKDIFEGKWVATASGYKIDPYVGTGGHEPLMIQVPLEVGADYNYSFSASWGAYDSWHGVEMHAYVCNFWNLGTTESGLNVSSSVLATQTFPFAGGTDVPFSLDFTADREDQTLLFQFGDVNDGNSSFWFEFDNLSVKKYIYPEAYPVLNPYKPLLAELIAEVESATLNTTTALSSDLSDALYYAKSAYTIIFVDDKDEINAYKKYLDNLQEKYDAAKAVDVTALDATITLAKAEGITTTTDAEDFLTDGTEKSVLDELLSKLRADRKVNAQKQPDIYTGTKKEDLIRYSDVTPEEYYFYNVGTGMWLTNGSDWDTHAAVSYAGLAIKMGDKGRGGENDYLLVNPWGNINFGMYLDHDSNDPWRFISTDKTNVYNIGVFDKTDDIFGYNSQAGTDGWKYWSTVTKVANASAEDQANALNQWKLVSKTERNEKLATATEANPVDATYLIKNPGLDRMQNLDENWTHEVAGGVFNHVTFGQNGEFNRSADYGVEFWNFQTFNLSQTLTGLPAGKYIISANAFFRKADSETQANAYNNGETSESKAYLYAGDNQVLLPNIASEAGKLPGIATQDTKDGAFVKSASEALEAFQTGLYKVSVEATVGADGTLTIGVKQPTDAGEGYGESWVVIDNFRLTYLGVETVTIDENTDYTPEAKAYANVELTRTINAYKWNTLVLPFSLTAEQTKAAFGSDVAVAEYSEESADASNATVNFNKKATPSIEANVPVLLKTSTAGTSYTFSGVNIQAGDAKVAGTNFDFVGSYAKSFDVPVDNYFISGDKLYKSEGSTTIKGTRAYIAPKSADARIADIVIDGENNVITGITDVKTDVKNQGTTYNLNGQRVAQPTKGVFIIDGKKVVIK